jgi:DNA-binding GntR family transcriptional regulator
MTETLAKEAAFVRIANLIREDILRGELLSGTSLIEAELTVSYGVSRNTLREALQLLRQQGLVSQEPNKSVRVKRISLVELKDIFVVRRVVEINALRHRSSVSLTHLDRLNAVIKREAHAIEHADWRAAGTESLRFHQEIVALHGSEILDQMFALLVTQLRLVFVSGKNERAFQEPWLVREAEIHRLLTENRCEEASAALEAYLNDSEKMLTELY